MVKLDRNSSRRVHNSRKSPVVVQRGENFFSRTTAAFVVYFCEPGLVIESTFRVSLCVYGLDCGLVVPNASQRIHSFIHSFIHSL